MEIEGVAKAYWLIEVSIPYTLTNFTECGNVTSVSMNKETVTIYDVPVLE